MAIALGMAAAKQLLPADQKLRKAHRRSSSALLLRTYHNIPHRPAGTSEDGCFVWPGRLESSRAPIDWGPRPHDAAELGGPRSAGAACLNFEMVNVIIFELV